MNKRLLVLAVAGAFGAAGAASAHSVGEVDLSIGGHVETGFVISDDRGEQPNGPNTSERKFDTEGEISFRATVNDNAYVRADIDINSRYSDTNETIEIEQLYGALRINDMAKVRVGRFTNPLGYESIDAPHKTTYSRSVIIDLLDDQTGLYQNTIEGVAVDLDLGPAKLTLGVLNEIGDTDEENSFLAHVSGEALPGLKLALGVLTQEDIDDSASNTFENLINFNAAYNIDLGAVNTTFFVDYLTAGEDLDNAYSLGAKAMFTDTIGATLRYDMAEYDNDDEETALTLGVNWAAAQSVDIRAEWRNDEFEANGAKVSDDDSVILSAVFSF